MAFLTYFGTQLVENVILIALICVDVFVFGYYYWMTSKLINAGRRHNYQNTKMHKWKFSIAFAILIANAIGVIGDILFQSQPRATVIGSYVVACVVWAFGSVTIRAEFLFLGFTTKYLRQFFIVNSIISLAKVAASFIWLKNIEYGQVAATILSFLLFFISSLAPQDLSKKQQEELEQMRARLIQQKERKSLGKSGGVFRETRSSGSISSGSQAVYKHKRYVPFYYNASKDPGYKSETRSSPNFCVIVSENERAVSDLAFENNGMGIGNGNGNGEYVESGASIDRRKVTEIFVTGWEKTNERLSEVKSRSGTMSNNRISSWHLFIIEYVKGGEIYFTKRTFVEFVELFRALQQNTKNILFPRLNFRQLPENSSAETLKTTQEVFSRMLQVVNSQKIGEHIYFHNFLLPRENLEDFTLSQALTFSNDLMGVNGSFRKESISSGSQNNLESLFRNFNLIPSESPSTSEQEQQLENSVEISSQPSTMSFCKKEDPPALEISMFFSIVKEPPKYSAICVLDWEFSDLEMGSTILQRQSSTSRAATDELEEQVFFEIRYVRIVKEARKEQFVKRTAKDIIRLRDYYELLYSRVQFPSIGSDSVSLNGVNNMQSFRSEGNAENFSYSINSFFAFLLQHQLFSLNLRKFLEESSEELLPQTQQTTELPLTLQPQFVPVSEDSFEEQH